jgi:arginyl-tRNA synthetase
MEIREEIKKRLLIAINKKWPDLDFTEKEFEINYPVSEFGDYSSNIALRIASKAKRSPLEIAEEIVNELKDGDQDIFEEISFVKPGFINFSLRNEFLYKSLKEVLQKKENYSQSSSEEKKQKLHLDFVSANPTGPVHLGNGRGGPFGDVLGNVFKKRGWDVWKEYYVNDFGNQIKILGHSVLKDEEAQYKGEYIDQLHEEIKEIDPFLVGQEASQKIIQEIIKPSMEKLGIEFDEYFSEKSLHDDGKIDAVFEELEKKDLIYEEDDAVWFRATKFGDEKDRVIRKNTGEVTYFGGDIAYHKDKFERGADKAINIWGADHHGDVKRVEGAVDALGYKGRLDIILSQMVKVIQDGKELKMSKRKGTYVSMDDLINEVGKDAVRFFFLMYSYNTHINFDINLAKEQSSKNPVFYVQYAHARICSVLRKADETGIEFDEENMDLSLLKDQKELELIKYFLRLPELLETIVSDYEVHRLPHYAIELADKFHSFYHDCRVIDEENIELTRARLAVVTATKYILRETLGVLGVDAPEKM